MYYGSMNAVGHPWQPSIKAKSKICSEFLMSAANLGNTHPARAAHRAVGRKMIADEEEPAARAGLTPRRAGIEVRRKRYSQRLESYLVPVVRAGELLSTPR